jgi:hypothetical protein
MAEDLLQTEADALIVMGKYRVNDREWEYPAPSGAFTIPLSSSNFGDQLVLDGDSSSRPRIMKSIKCSQSSKTIYRIKA